MIITRTPLRVSFAGGGTDLPSFYRKYGGGAVVSAAIDRYVHVLVNDKFDAAIRVAYSRTEDVEVLDQLQHELVREAMRLAGVPGGIEVHTIADIPSEGTGLGSSSSVTVGLLNAFHAYRGTLKGPAELAEEACSIEIDILHGTLGKQDQYAAAFGGVQFFEFREDDTVRVAPIPLTTRDKERLASHLSLFYTGITRQAQGILKRQEARLGENRESLRRMRELAGPTRDAILAGNWVRLGELLDEGWQLKRGLSAGISTEEIDAAYARARAAGAWGGKITGAGGGGFLLLAHPPEQSAQVASALSPWRKVPVRFSAEGSRILFVGR
ncbi:MAG: GHMP kinase [Thermoplasmata archaeon]|nr:GHMP kinase [Thermoplasmata archaeon]MCI4337723.1 GHMP kinase [Thermoplasmata archaeon]MCI4341872.1 GHMP kinase [Thermoplasmata archaeon]